MVNELNERIDELVDSIAQKHGDVVDGSNDTRTIYYFDSGRHARVNINNWNQIEVDLYDVDEQWMSVTTESSL